MNEIVSSEQQNLLDRIERVAAGTYRPEVQVGISLLAPVVRRKVISEGYDTQRLVAWLKAKQAEAGNF